MKDPARETALGVHLGNAYPHERVRWYAQAIVLPDLRRFHAFIVLAEELHFGRAARRLMMSQSPLSRLIYGLEQDAGIVLFERNRRSVKLTPAGRSFLLDARDIIALMNDAVIRTKYVANAPPTAQK